MKPSYVYFLVNEENTLIKIGKANNLQTRIVGLIKAGNKIDLKKSFAIELLNERESFVKESYFHKYFAAKRTKLESPIDGSTEWFDISIMKDLNHIIQVIIDSSGRKVKTIKRLNFATEYEQKKKYSEERTYNKITEQKLLLPFLIYLRMQEGFSLKINAAEFVKNCLIVTPEEMHSPNDRTTSFIDIRIDNIISHKTLEKFKLTNTFKVKFKAMIKITDQGDTYIKETIQEDYQVLLLSILIQKELFCLDNVKKQLSYFLTEDTIMNTLKSEYIEEHNIEGLLFYSITKKGKLYLDKKLRSL